MTAFLSSAAVLREIGINLYYRKDLLRLNFTSVKIYYRSMPSMLSTDTAWGPSGVCVAMLTASRAGHRSAPPRETQLRLVTGLGSGRA
jgi:hypothetical protein